ncbi:MAG: hypothetical protein ACR2HO_00740 [Rubrobacteraceae bacterium]
MFRSVTAVLLGVLIALVIGLLAVFGIVWPLFEVFLDPELAGGTAWITVVLVFAAIFSFYFGGMATGYRAPNHRLVHGTLVAPITFAISPIVNLATRGSAFPGVKSPGTLILVLVFLCASVAAAYVGARRGEGLYDYNRSHLRRQRSR